jgi:translocation protein SEC63
MKYLQNHFFLLQRTIKSIRQFVAMDDGQRRSVLRSITDEQYYDIMNVLAIYPHITMNVSCGGI